MSRSGIYGIKNTSNGKWYIGQTRDLSKRKYEHFYDLANSRHFNPHFQAAYDKYGKSSFEFHVIEECVDNVMDVRERLWIQYHKSNQSEFGYNKETGGHINKHHSLESRKKIADAGTGRHHSLESRIKMSKSCMGRRLSDETKQKISLSLRGNKCHFGRHHSEETKLKISKIGKGIKRSDEFKANVSAFMKGRQNTLGHRHSDETKRKMSETRMGHKGWSKGKHLSVQHRQKISESLTGKKLSTETRKKLSESRKTLFLLRKNNLGCKGEQHPLTVVNNCSKENKIAS